MATTVIQLTDTQKIEILEKTKEILGPNGENWTKACWWGIKYTEEEIIELLKEEGLSPDFLYSTEFKEFDNESEREFTRREVPTADVDSANTWCLMGAIEEAAYRLGIIREREPSERFAEPISLAQLVQSSDEWDGWSVVDVNDNPNTTFDTIRKLIDERLAQLREA